MSNDVKYVTRRVVEGCKYDVYTWGEDDKPKLLGTVEISGRVSKKDLAEKFGIDAKNIFTKAGQPIKKKYVMTVEEFMKHAKDLDEIKGGKDNE